MPRSTRVELRRKADCALKLLDNLDVYLMEMDLVADGRQPAILEAKQMLVKGHDALRTLWQALRQSL